MPVSTANALYTAALCNMLLAAIDRLEVMVTQLFDPADDPDWFAHSIALGEWIADARESVLDIKSRL